MKITVLGYCCIAAAAFAIAGQVQTHTSEPHPKVTPQVAVPESHEISPETQSLYIKVHDMNSQAQVLELQLEKTKQMLANASQTLGSRLVKECSQVNYEVKEAPDTVAGVQIGSKLVCVEKGK